jgi:beta-lactamase regulating signal transducer with metallopeptidase domain
VNSIVAQIMPWLSCIISNVVLASLLALAAWYVQRRTGWHALARILWVLVLVKLVTPPLVSVPLRASPGAMACALGACGCEHHAQAMLRGTLPWLLLSVWLVGAGATGWTALCRWIRFRSLLAHASPAPPEWQTLAAHLSAELSLRRPPEVLAVPGRLPPLVVAGRRRPRLLLPMDLMGLLNDSQREALLLHELVHLQRGDHLVRMLELAVSVAYWWLPVVCSIGRQLRDCEEACCDAAVVARLPQARRDYARLLLDVLDFASPLPRRSVPPVTAMSAAQNLEQRLRSILGATDRTRASWPVGSFAAGSLVVALACAIVPCQLHYEVARPTASAAISTGPGRAATEACPPDDDCNLDPLKCADPVSQESPRPLPASRNADVNRNQTPWISVCCPS